MTMASPSDCMANTCSGGGGGGGGGSGGATSAARAAASFSSILPLASARSFLVGMTSTPVTSSAGAPSKSICAVVSSSRLTWPCSPTISTSKRSAPCAPARRRRRFSATSSAYSGATRSASRRSMRLTRSDADEARELAVGVQDDVAMHEHRFVDALAEFGEQFGAGFVAARGARGAQQQLVHRDAERLHVELRRARHRSRCAAADARRSPRAEP